MKPPKRLLEDPAIAPDLRADLERAGRASQPYDTTAGLVSLQAAIGVKAAASIAPAPVVGAGASASAPAAPVAIGAAGALKIGAPILAVAVATAAAVGWQHRAPAPAAPPHRKPAPTVAAPAPSEPAPALETPAAVAEPTVPAPAPKRSAAADAELQREVAQLGRIRQLLGRDPQQALQLAQAGHREFGRGVLRQEREGLAVIALWRLDRRDAAAKRTRAFIELYPQSPLREELERLQRERMRGDR